MSVARQRTEEALGRIEAHNASLNALVTVDREGALAAADDLDQHGRREGASRPLVGIPLAVKDALCTQDLRTTAASRVLAGYVPPYDATTVAKVRSAGAIIVGKANMDEFSMGSSTEHSAFGAVKNPWDLARTPGGSSGGSAAAVAADLVPIALGSDTGGSIRQPAAFTGTVGLCPTYGAVSRYGLIAFASSLDRVGPIAQNVHYARILFDAIAGVDPRDSTTRPSTRLPGKRGKTSIAGLRVGVPREFFDEGLAADVRDSVEGALSHLRDQGANVEPCSLASTELAVATYYVLAAAEASSNLTRYDGLRFGSRADASSLGEVYRKTRGEFFGAEVKRRILLGTFVLSAGYYDAYYGKAMAARARMRREFHELFQRFDVVCTPTTPTTAWRFGEKTDPLSMYLSDLYTLPSSIAGLPAVSVPCAPSRESGLPVGFQIIGPEFSEHMLLDVAQEVEAAFPSQRPPQFRARA